MTVPREILSEVFGGADANALLGYLARYDRPVRYNQAQRDLDFRREQFRHALSALERFGLVTLSALPKKDRSERDPRRAVYMRLSPVGTIVSQMHERMQDSWSDLMVHNQIPRDLWRPTLMAGA